ncbi:MAG: hypothetical protein IJ716_13610 [Lachnospiraceae bacterium]|nr:hypothetical protein [Lachnospiraceae bacterium]
MRLVMGADQLIIKSLFSIKQIAYRDIRSIHTSETGTVIVLKDGGEVTAKGETVQALRHPELKALLENYPVSFEDASEGGVTYDSTETNRMIAAAKSLAETLASGFVKAHFGQEYDIDVRIVENILGASMEFRLQRDGQVIADFPGYEEAEEPETSGKSGEPEDMEEPRKSGEPEGPDRGKLIDSMDLSFLCKWDAAGASGWYGVTNEVTDPKRMEEYVVGYMLEDFYERYGKIAGAKGNQQN